MKAAELYQAMAATVCRHTGVGEVDMLESNKEECVDAKIFTYSFSFPISHGRGHLAGNRSHPAGCKLYTEPFWAENKQMEYKELHDGHWKWNSPHISMRAIWHSVGTALNYSQSSYNLWSAVSCANIRISNELANNYYDSIELLPSFVMQSNWIALEL